MDENALNTSWYDSKWIPFLNVTNVLDYFSELSNPFYDRTCNNEVIKMQRLKLEQINSMTGIEYVLYHVEEPILYVIRKQQRYGPDNQVVPLAHYHVVAGVVYKTPDIGAIINARMLAATNHLQACFDEAWSMARYDPSSGYSWKFKDDVPEVKETTKVEISEETRVVARRQRVDELLFGLSKKFAQKCASDENKTKKRDRDENGMKPEIETEKQDCAPPLGKRMKYA